jgi:hypothetical protein
LCLGTYSTHTAVPPVFDLVPGPIEKCNFVEWVFLFPVARIAYSVLHMIFVQPFTFFNHLQFVAAEVLGECRKHYFLTTEFHPLYVL